MKRIVTGFLVFAVLLSSVISPVFAKQETEDPNVLYDLDFEEYDNSVRSKSGWDVAQGYMYTMYPGKNESDNSTCFTMHNVNHSHGLFKPEPYVGGEGIYRLSFDILRHGSNGSFFLRIGNKDCTAMDSKNDNNMFQTFVMRGGNVGHFGGGHSWNMMTVKEYAENVWNHLDMWMDFDMHKIYYYWNGEYLAESPMSFEEIRWLWFRYESKDYSDYVSLDNVKLEKIDVEYAEKLSKEGVSVPNYMMFPVDIFITSKNSGHIFRKEQIPTLDISYVNKFNGNIKFKAEYDVFNRKGEQVLDIEKELELKEGETLNEAMEFPVERFDLYKLYAKYTNISNGVVLEKDVIEFSWANTVTPGVKNYKVGFGALMSHRNKSMPDQLLPIVDMLGTGVQRDTIGHTREADGTISMGVLEEVYDKIDAFSKESGVLFMTQRGGPGIVPKDEAGLKEIEEGMEYIARRYKDSIMYYEFYNEPDFKRTDEMSCEEYARGLEYFYRGIKKGNPNAVVIGCVVTRANPEWIKGVLEAGGGEYMDVVSVHPYQGQSSPEGTRWDEWVSRARIAMEEAGYGDMELWVTEGNAPASTQYTTQLQHGWYFVRHLTAMERTKCVDLFIQHALQTATLTDNIDEDNYGILNGWGVANPYAAHPEFLMACNYFEQTENAVFADAIVEGRNYINRYKTPDGINVLIMNSDFESNTISLKLGAEKGSLADAYGNAVEVEGKDGIFTFTLNDAPLYFTYRGDDFELCEGTLKVDKVSRELTVGSTGVYTISGVGEQEITLDYPDGIEASVKKQGDDAVVTVVVNEIPEVFDFDMICNEYGTKVYRDIINVTVGKQAYLQLGCDFVERDADVSLTVKPYNDNTTKHWQMNMKVKNNNGQEVISGEIVFERPAVFAANFKPLKIEELKPGEEREFTYNIPPEDTGSYTYYNGSFKLTNGEEIPFALADHPRSFHYKQGAPILNIHAVKRRKTDVVIDASIDPEEWKEHKVYSFGKNEISYGTEGSELFGVIEQSIQGSADDYKGNVDFSGDMYAQWDDEYLYVAAVINDDNHYAKEAPTRFYLDDLLSVYTQPTRTQRHETRIDMALSEFMDMKPVMFCNWTELVDRIAVGVVPLSEDGAQVDIKRENGATIYEARIPAYLISDEPWEKHLNFFLNLYVRDYDVETDKNISWNGWTCLVE